MRKVLAMKPKDDKDVIPVTPPVSPADTCSPVESDGECEPVVVPVGKRKRKAVVCACELRAEDPVPVSKNIDKYARQTEFSERLADLKERNSARMAKLGGYKGFHEDMVDYLGSRFTAEMFQELVGHLANALNKYHELANFDVDAESMRLVFGHRVTDHYMYNNN